MILDTLKDMTMTQTQIREVGELTLHLIKKCLIPMATGRMVYKIKIGAAYYYNTTGLDIRNMKFYKKPATIIAIESITSHLKERSLSFKELSIKTDLYLNTLKKYLEFMLDQGLIKASTKDKKPRYYPPLNN